MYVSRKSLKAVSGPLRAARMKERFATSVPDRKYFSRICFYLFFYQEDRGAVVFVTRSRAELSATTQGLWGREPPGREGEARPATRSNRFVPLATMRSPLSGTDCDKPRKPLINSFFYMMLPAAHRPARRLLTAGRGRLSAATEPHPSL